MKYNAILTFNDGDEISLMDEFPYDKPFDSEEEAMEAAENLLNDMRTGAEVLHMSNPGDYPMPDDDDMHADIDIVEVEE